MLNSLFVSVLNLSVDPQGFLHYRGSTDFFSKKIDVYLRKPAFCRMFVQSNKRLLIGPMLELKPPFGAAAAGASMPFNRTNVGIETCEFLPNSIFSLSFNRTNVGIETQPAPEYPPPLNLLIGPMLELKLQYRCAEIAAEKLLIGPMLELKPAIAAIGLFWERLLIGPMLELKLA